MHHDRQHWFEGADRPRSGDPGLRALVVEPPRSEGGSDPRAVRPVPDALLRDPQRAPRGPRSHGPRPPSPPTPAPAARPPPPPALRGAAGQRAAGPVSPARGDGPGLPSAGGATMRGAALVAVAV